MKIIKEESFDVSLNIPGITKPLSERLQKYEKDIKNLEIDDVNLIRSSARLTRTTVKNLNGPELFQNRLARQRLLCPSILNHIDRLPTNNLYKNINDTLHPKLLLKSDYQRENFEEKLKSILESLGISHLLAAILIGHERFYYTLKDTDNQEKFQNYWKVSNRWNPLGVIESFMNPNFFYIMKWKIFVICYQKLKKYNFLKWTLNVS